jgi:hypothetical protein
MGRSYRHRRVDQCGVHWDSGGFAEKSSFSRAGGESKRRKRGLGFNQLEFGSKADFVRMSASGAKQTFGRLPKPALCQQPVPCVAIKLAYSITSSARRTSSAGISCPIDFAVLRLMTSSKLVGCSTGTSEALTPVSIFTICRARWR